MQAVYMGLLTLSSHEKQMPGRNVITQRNQDYS